MKIASLFVHVLLIFGAPAHAALEERMADLEESDGGTVLVLVRPAGSGTTPTLERVRILPAPGRSSTDICASELDR